jgi:putative pyruvate formate lyase activating enzyme
MYRQVGDGWQTGPEGELHRGLLVRMLVLPEGLAGIEQNLEWISRTLSPRVTISLLAQYHPAHRVRTNSALHDLDRQISTPEWRRAVAALAKLMEGDRHYVQGAMI